MNKKEFLSETKFKTWNQSIQERVSMLGQAALDKGISFQDMAERANAAWYDRVRGEVMSGSQEDYLADILEYLAVEIDCEVDDDDRVTMEIAYAMKYVAESKGLI